MRYSKSSKKESDEVFKIQQESDDLFKIQQEREGGTQKPAREREVSYSKASKREKEVLKSQQEREGEREEGLGRVLTFVVVERVDLDRG